MRVERDLNGGVLIQDLREWNWAEDVSRCSRYKITDEHRNFAFIEVATYLSKWWNIKDKFDKTYLRKMSVVEK